jgi:hypothetical protein
VLPREAAAGSQEQQNKEEMGGGMQGAAALVRTLGCRCSAGSSPRSSTVCSEAPSAGAVGSERTASPKGARSTSSETPPTSATRKGTPMAAT